MRFSTFLATSLLATASSLSAIAAEPMLRVISGKTTINFTAEEFAALPHTQVNLAAHDKTPAREYSGVPMSVLLLKVGAPLGQKMGGKGELTTGVMVRCRDKYAVLFALAEFDEHFTARTILVADKQDGQPLPASAAPLRIIAPGDKLAARSCKQVVAIEVLPLGKS